MTKKGKRITCGDIFRKYAASYIQKFCPPPHHRKVIDAVRRCRTAALGGHAMQCTDCGSVHIYYNSCSNRHCPQCRAFEKEKWVEKRKNELLPVPYLHLVFTVPHELNPLVLSNDRLIYSILFKAVSKTVKIIAADPRWLGAQSGMIAVLHTWGSNLSLHPHLHCIIPCGGLNKTQTRWISTKKKNFLAPNKSVIAPIFRAVFMRMLTRAFDEERLVFFGQAKIFEDLQNLRGLFNKLNNKSWNVYAKKSFGGPAQILNYLSRYTHRIAISNNRIAALNGSTLTFSVKNYKKKNDKGLPVIEQLPLNVLEFMRRFLMHVLPPGFQRIRYYGILATRNRKTKIKKIQQLFKFHPPKINPLHWKERLEKLTGQDPDTCPDCGNKSLVLLGFIPSHILPPGRSPPQFIIITTPQGESVPLTV